MQGPSITVWLAGLINERRPRALVNN